MRILVLGMGNTIVRDDGVGIYVVRELTRLCTRPNIDVHETSLAGLHLLDLLDGYDAAIVVDSIKTVDATPGEVYRLTLDSLKSTVRMGSPHSVNFATAVELGRQLGRKMPTDVEILAIEVEDNTTFGEGCTPAVQAAIPKVVRMVEEALGARTRDR